MTELNDFYNEGFGWTCRHCDRELKAASEDQQSRLLREGEAETKHANLSTAVAKWADPARRTLVCPRCGITELVEKS